MLVAKNPDEIDICREEVVRDLARELGRIKLQDRGVLVQASTLGSLEALLEFLKDSKIPVSLAYYLFITFVCMSKLLFIVGPN